VKKQIRNLLALTSREGVGLTGSIELGLMASLFFSCGIQMVEISNMQKSVSSKIKP